MNTGDRNLKRQRRGEHSPGSSHRNTSTTQSENFDIVVTDILSSKITLVFGSAVVTKNNCQSECRKLPVDADVCNSLLGRFGVNRVLQVENNIDFCGLLDDTSEKKCQSVLNERAGEFCAVTRSDTGKGLCFFMPRDMTVESDNDTTIVAKCFPMSGKMDLESLHCALCLEVKGELTLSSRGGISELLEGNTSDVAHHAQLPAVSDKGIAAF